uniref:RAB6-interacting golgin n=1 Tax=Sinocyclocheilus grahami TaxID=75366 RepID=A0A672Q3A2_SINGR
MTQNHLQSLHHQQSSKSWAKRKREKNHLQQLQWEQRIMEEKNKKRKALLTKTIAEKSKQTQAEAVKLKKIQRELQLLDDSVSSDIGILRKLIEQSSMDYSQAW